MWVRCGEGGRAYHLTKTTSLGGDTTRRRSGRARAAGGSQIDLCWGRLEEERKFIEVMENNGHSVWYKFVCDSHYKLCDCHYKLCDCHITQSDYHMFTGTKFCTGGAKGTRLYRVQNMYKIKRSQCVVQILCDSHYKLCDCHTTQSECHMFTGIKFCTGGVKGTCLYTGYKICTKFV